jgi:predicted nuclease of predicted toxin-antitoxin system
VKFLVDENLPVALARWLNERGHEALHTSAIDLNASADGRLASYALRAGAVIVTKDKDFLVISTTGPRVIHIRSGNLSSQALLSVCERVWPLVEAGLQAGERVVTIRGAD